MYDKDNDHFVLSVRNLNSGALCSKPQAVRVSNVAWARDGQALLYVVTDQNKRPFRLIFLHKCFYLLLFLLPTECNCIKLSLMVFAIRLFCSVIGSTDEDVLLHEEADENVYVNIRHTKDFRFVAVNTFSTTSSKVSV